MNDREQAPTIRQRTWTAIMEARKNCPHTRMSDDNAEACAQCLTEGALQAWRAAMAQDPIGVAAELDFDIRLVERG